MIPPGKIFVIGLSRTGTTSMHLLLQSLGFRSIHFVWDLLFDRDADILNAADAFSDTPIPLYYPYLDRKFPGSKFILTTRPKEPWLNSMKFLFTHGPAIGNWTEPVHAYHQCFYGTRTFKRKKLSRHYESFHQNVAHYFERRPHDLITISLNHPFPSDGFCDFLEIPRQPMQLPRANRREKAPLKRRFLYSTRRHTPTPLKDLLKSFLRRP